MIELPNVKEFLKKYCNEHNLLRADVNIVSFTIEYGKQLLDYIANDIDNELGCGGKSIRDIKEDLK